MPKIDFGITPPLMNAAGSLGFTPDRHGRADLSALGAFVTNPVSAGPRSPAQGMRYAATSAGFVLHTGHPNPGFNAVLRQYAAAWARSSLPIIVHILAQHPDDCASMIRRLEGMEGVMGIELGLPPSIETATARSMIEAALGELLLIVRLPFEQALEVGQTAKEAGAGALSLSAPRACLPRPDGNLFEGRLFGPAVLPIALYQVRQLAELGLPVIGSGGVYTTGDVQAMLNAGAAAVQMDSGLWRALPPPEA